MKKLIRKTASAFLAAALAVSTFASVPAAAATESDQSPKITTITFDFDIEGVAVETDKAGNPLTIEDISGEVGTSEFIPKVQLVKSGYKFQGWTMNGLKGYQPGDVVQFPEEDAVMTPVFYCKDYEDSHKAVYNCDFEGSTLDATEVPSVYYAPEGKILTLSLLSIQREGYKHLGWYVNGDSFFRGGERIVMPDEDIEITPRWLKIRALTYYAGDYDRIVGATHIFFEQPETTSTELQTNTRFSRDGFTLVGWHCSADDQIYKPEETFTMPCEDIILTAVWKPIDYKIVFNPGTGSSDITRVVGTTDTTISIPECTAEKAGYTFSGWKYEGEIYQPGDEFFVGGVKSGLGYAFTAVWTKSDAVTTTTTTTLTTTAETTTDVTTTGPQIVSHETFLFDSVKSYPAKTNYKTGEELDLTGLVFTGESTLEAGSIMTYDDPDYVILDSTIRITGSDGKSVERSDFSKLAAGKYTVSIKGDAGDYYAYNLCSDVDISFEVTIKDAGTEKVPDFIISVVGKESGKPVNDAVLRCSHYMKTVANGQTIQTAPIVIVDTSESNPFIIKGEKGMTSQEVKDFYPTSESDYTFTEKDVEIKEKDGDVYITIKVEKKGDTPEPTDNGDANCDGQLNMADAVLIMQSIANPDKYALTEQGKINADVNKSGDVTNLDALAIQQFKLGIISDLSKAASSSDKT